MKKLSVLLVAMVVGISSFMNVKAQNQGNLSSTDSLTLQSEAITLESVKTYTVEVQAQIDWTISTGSDVTSWLVNRDGSQPFANDDQVAVVTAVKEKNLQLQIDASQIKEYLNPSDDYSLYLLPDEGSLPDNSSAALEIGEYVVPIVEIQSSLYASAYTYSKSTLKEALDQRVSYDDQSKAVIQLVMDDLDDEAIDSSNAKVALVEGDGYYVDEYLFKATSLPGEWKDGTLSYVLQKGDLELDRSLYEVSDTNSGREWSCLGGDGSGNYYFNLSLSGITYHGLPLPSKTFVNHVFIYGQNFIGLANMTFQDGMNIDASFASLAQRGISEPVVSTEPVFTWVGAGDKPILCDNLADDVYISWPQGDDASTLTSEDVHIVLSNAYGDEFVLASDEYAVQTTSNETQIAITLLYLPNTPVYTTMTVSVTSKTLNASKEYEIGSVYVHETQQGGGGTTIDGTVTAYSFYGLETIKDVKQIVSPASYVLSYQQDGITVYYAQDAQGNGILVTEQASAMTFDAMGVEDQNIQVVNNTVYVTSRVNATASKTIGTTSYTFNKVYSGGKLLNPANTNGLVVEAGYVLPSSNGWATHESWPWYANLGERWSKGWTGIDVQPEGSHFTVKVNKGTSQQFSADGQTNQVNWCIVGEVSDSKTSISEDGLLTVGEDETATMFVVYAKAKHETDEHDQGAVAIQVNELVEKVDTTQLEALVNQYADVDASLYTEESYMTFQSVYHNAKNLLVSEKKTQAELDQMSIELTSAYEALVKLVIKDGNTESPATGDTTNVLIYGGLAFGSFLFLCLRKKVKA